MGVNPTECGASCPDTATNINSHSLAQGECNNQLTGQIGSDRRFQLTLGEHHFLASFQVVILTSYRYWDYAVLSKITYHKFVCHVIIKA